MLNSRLDLAPPIPIVDKKNRYLEVNGSPSVDRLACLTPTFKEPGLENIISSREV
jgi:hypothetical protein